MAALMPCSRSFAQQLCKRAVADIAQDGLVCVVANINTANQVVISGHTEAVLRAVELGKAGVREERVKRAVMLDVATAFHSPIQQSARRFMEPYIAAVPIQRPCVPLISNVTAQPVSDVDEIRALMLEHITSPVQWHKSAQHSPPRAEQPGARLGAVS